MTIKDQIWEGVDIEGPFTWWSLSNQQLYCTAPTKEEAQRVLDKRLQRKADEDKLCKS